MWRKSIFNNCTIEYSNERLELLRVLKYEVLMLNQYIIYNNIEIMIIHSEDEEWICNKNINNKETTLFATKNFRLSSTKLKVAYIIEAAAQLILGRAKRVLGDNPTAANSGHNANEWYEYTQNILSSLFVSNVDKAVKAKTTKAFTDVKDIKLNTLLIGGEGIIRFDYLYYIMDLYWKLCGGLGTVEILLSIKGVLENHTRVKNYDFLHFDGLVSVAKGEKDIPNYAEYITIDKYKEKEPEMGKENVNAKELRTVGLLADKAVLSILNSITNSDTAFINNCYTQRNSIGPNLEKLSCVKNKAIREYVLNMSTKFKPDIKDNILEILWLEIDAYIEKFEENKIDSTLSNIVYIATLSIINQLVSNDLGLSVSKLECWKELL